MKKCLEITLSNKRCNQYATDVIKDDEIKKSDFCYYHKKLRNGLTTPAESIGASRSYVENRN